MNVNGVRHSGRLALIQEFDAKFEVWYASITSENHTKIHDVMAQYESKHGSAELLDMLRRTTERLHERHRNTAHASEGRDAHDVGCEVRPPAASYQGKGKAKQVETRQ